MSLEKDITGVKKLFEMPWVNVGDDVVDFELEKYLHSKDEAVAHIKAVLSKRSVEDQDMVVDELFQEFPSLMQKLGLTKEDLL